MKNGLLLENDELIYYKDGRPYHAGVIEVDGAIYYIGHHGKAVKGYHVVHGEMSHGLLEHGTYRFGEDYKLDKGFYIAPKKINHSKKKHRKHKKHSKRKNNKNVKNALICLSLFLFVLAVVLTVVLLLNNHPAQNPSPSVNTPAQQSVVLPSFTEEVLLCSPEAKQFYDGELSVEMVSESGAPYRPLAFNYVLENGDGQLLLSEHADLSKAKTYTLTGGENVLYIYNLKTDTDYYYRVIADYKTYDGHFKTAKSTRFLYIPGVKNVRDIGGVSTNYGKTVKQGMLIRGTELDGLVMSTYFLQAEDVSAVQKEFGFVCDFDLRGDVFTHQSPSRLGNKLKHPVFEAPAYGAIFGKAWQLTLKDMFTTLADPGNYPMYLHCTHGADRTGTLIYLLQGVLGVSEADMQREYQTTALDLSGFADHQLEIVTAGLQNYPGATTQEKIVNFLTETVGVTQAELDSIRSILLEE